MSWFSIALPQLSKPGSLRRSHRSFNAYLSILSEASTETTWNPSSTNMIESILTDKTDNSKGILNIIKFDVNFHDFFKATNNNNQQNCGKYFGIKNQAPIWFLVFGLLGALK